MQALSRHAALRLTVCGLSGLMLLLGGCSKSEDDGPSSPNASGPSPNGSTPGMSSEPSNRPTVSPGDSPSVPQSNASFAQRRSFELDGAQQVPVVSTRAAGMAELSLSTADGLLTGNVTHSVADATGASIRIGDPGESGAELLSLERASGTTFVLPAGAVLTAGQQADFEAGRLHVVVSSSAHPDGEIRGQLSEEPVGVTFEPTLADIQAKVFTPICSGCHDGTGTTLPAVMDLTSADASYDSLVNFASIGEPDLLRVQASFSADSLIVRKLLGTQAVGSRMPFRGERLDTVVIDAIREWIDDGAPR